MVSTRLIVGFVKKCFLVSVYYFCTLFLFSIPDFLYADCECPEPITNGQKSEIDWITPRKMYAAPGQVISLIAVVTNDVSPCCDPGDDWWYCFQMEKLLPWNGNGWISIIDQGGSDCRTQHWAVPVPFDNSDEDSVYTRYHHLKASTMEIFVVPSYEDPDPCKTSDMDPVNTYTGALRITDEDYSNSDLVFKRDYDPMRLAGTHTPDISKRWKNPVGIGWQHNYNIYIEEIQQNNGDTIIDGCLIHKGKTTNVYKKLADGNYQPRRGNHADLTKSGNTWKLYNPDGVIYYFGSSNKIDSIVDRNGKKTTFAYSGSFLSQVTGKDNHTLSFSYDSDSLLRWVSITENSNTKKFEYRYSPVTCIFNSDTFDLLGTYYLAQVLLHYPTGSADSLMSLNKYYYDNLKMVAKLYPHGSYTESDTVWQGNYKKGDRLYIWYDSLGQAIYQEVIDNDGDTLLSNDKTVYRAYTKYFRRPGKMQSRMDSALTYVYQQAAGVDSAHDPYDTTFTPQAPTSNYSTRKRNYHNDVIGRQIFIETNPDSDSTFMTKYYKDKDFNDTLVISPYDDTTKYTYKTYTLNDTTKYSRNPEKIKYPTDDSALYYYHAPDNNAPAFFLLDSTIDELSRKTEYFYDDNYNLDSLRYVSRYVAGVGTTTVTTDYTYNSKGNLTQVKDPLDNSTYFSYAPNDTGSYLTKTRIDMSPSGSGNEDIIAKYKYNTDIGKTDTLVYFRDYPGDSSIIRYTYDVMNRSKEIFQPDNTKDVFTYDKRGNLLKKETYESSTQHFLIKYEYDARDRLTKVKEYKDLSTDSFDSTVYKYNLDDELIGFVNANDTAGISTEIKYTYDAGRLIEVEYADTTSDSLGYYQNGNLKFKEDRRGKVISYVYDDRDRLTKKRYFNSFAAYQSPDSVPAETLKFSYDDVGNMVSMLDKNGTINYSYDEMNGLDTLNCYQDMLIAYEYDKAGNKKKLKVIKASDTTTVYLNQSYPTYDEANRLKRTAVGTDTFAFTYWDTGPIKKIDYPNDVKEQYKLTSRNFIDVMADSLGNNQLFKFDYKYNAKGDRDTLIFYLSRLMQTPISGTIIYLYDDLRRLTQAQYPQSIYNKTNKYIYDKVGNRLKKIAGTDTTDYSYNKRNNQLQTEGSDSYYYDNNGNMIKHTYGGGLDTLFYDFENRLIEFVKRINVIPPPYDTLWFRYCGMGKRIKKIEKPNGENPDTTSYAYDGMYAVCEFGGHLDLQAKYVYANGILLARYDESPADSHYFHHDGLGSIMGLTNENGFVEQSYLYDDFGSSLGSWGNVSNSYLYTGQEYDGSISGLYNLRARYYDSGIGRFASMDPILQSKILVTSGECSNPASAERCDHTLCPYARGPQDLNCYTYVANNSINWIDPWGLDRYKKCEIHKTWVGKLICRLMVDWRCGSSYGEGYFCCEMDLMNCLDDIDWDCDPEADEKYKICMLKFDLCVTGLPQ